MRRVIGFILATTASSSTLASCPEYLDQTMRKLHSADTVELCNVQNGQPMLIINTASHCGYTPQFKGLEALHQKYQEQGLVVIGFASNDFRQEAKDEETAADVCFVNYGVSFTMISPSHIKGDEANPVFKELASQTQAPQWNFNKYLVDRDGKVTEHFGSSTTPDSKVLAAAIENIL